MSDTLDTGASKSFMSKLHYLRCKSLHSFSKFASKTQRIQVGNGLYVSMLFIIPIMIDIHGHRLKIVTLVSEIHQNLDLVLGIKKIFDLGQMWLKYLPLAIFAYNTFNTPNLANYSPYELLFGRKQNLLLHLETTPDI